MNKNIKNHIDIFLKNVSTCSDKINKFSKSIDDKDKKIRSIIENLNTSLENINIDNSKNEFMEEINNSISVYRYKSKEWMKALYNYMDGKEFINKFEKSMLVVVFGNVNVGKSSIGNFISGSIPELKEYYNQIPDYYVYDFADSDKKEEPVKMSTKTFKENNTEETTEIQYYTLNNGLTWVDSPGIHSINGKNEDLAKKYVDYADLVIFVMTSSSPAKHDEYMELSKLINKRKPILGIINKSDDNDYAEQDGKVIYILKAKTKEDREKQENYVKSLFDKEKDQLAYIDSLDTISMSIKLAKQSLKNNNYTEFIDSGLPKFYNRLGNLLRDNAIDLKTKAPKQRINSVIKDILYGFSNNDIKTDGICDMEYTYKNILSKLDSTIEKVKNLKSDILKEVRIKSTSEIDMFISGSSLNLQMEKSVDNTESRINEIILDNFNKVIKKKITQVISDFNYDKLNEIKLNINTKLEAKYQTFTYDIYDIEERLRDPEGIIENVCSLFGKKYYSLKKVRRVEEKKLVVGDNSNEIIQDIINNLEKELSSVVDEYLEDICEKYFNIEREIVENILRLIDITKKELSTEIIGGDTDDIYKDKRLQSSCIR